jgi:HEAT repeat protein
MNSMEQSEPYKGLRPYEEGDQGNFFGREAECRILLDKFLASRLTLLFAASGVGKSSLLQAAVLPHLKDSRQENRDAVYYKDWVSPPLAGLKQAIRMALEQDGTLDGDLWPQAADSHSLRELLAFAALFVRPPLVLVLDQFEEFFQYHRYAPSFQPFIDALAEVVNDRSLPVSLVLSMREDFALELNAFKPRLPTVLFENFYRLEPLARDNAIKAIVEPVQRLGFDYEPELLEALLKDLASREERSLASSPFAEAPDTVEPAYLQIVCAQLWAADRADPEKRLRWRSYQNQQCAAGILKNYIDSTIASFSAADKRLASEAFDHLITRRGTKLAYTAQDLANTLHVDATALGKVLDKLEGCRILRRQQREQVFWYELYHDLFSKPIENWNYAYKTRQRNRRALILAALLAVSGFLLYAGYDAALNLSQHHLRLNGKRATANSIEVYQGEADSPDLFHLSHYQAEAGYQGWQIEPDKLRVPQAITQYPNLIGELIGNLPLEDRVAAYWEDGQSGAAIQLAQALLNEENLGGAKRVIALLERSGSALSAKTLADSLEKFNKAEIKTQIIEALGAMGGQASQYLMLALPKLAPELQSSAAQALGLSHDSQTLGALAQLLNHPDKAVRAGAMLSLMGLKSLALDILRQSLGNPNPDVRELAASALGALEDQQALVPLQQSLSNDAAPEVRVAAAQALKELAGAQALDALLAKLDDPEPQVRQAIVEILGGLNTARAIPPLLSRLQDPSLGLDMQLSLIKALQQLHAAGAEDASVAPALLEKFNAPTLDPKAQAAIVEALGQLGDASVAKPLLAKLDDPGLQLELIATLGKLRDASALKPLLGKLNSPDPTVRIAALSALEKIGGAPVLAAFFQHLGDPNQAVRVEAKNALETVEDAQKPALLIQGLQNPNALVRQAAAELLNGSKEKGVATALIQRLSDPVPAIVKAVAEALVASGDPRAAPALLQHLGDPVPETRKIVAEALEKLGDKSAVAPLFERLGDTDWEAQNAAFSALQKLADARHIELLLQGLNSDNENVQKSAASLLGAVPDPRAVRPLLQALGNAAIDYYIIEALGKQGDRQAIEPLFQHLPKVSDNAISRIVEALRKLVGRNDVDLLLQKLGSGNASIRNAAIQLLQNVPDPKALDPLKKRLLDAAESDKTRVEAVVALGAIGGKQAGSVLIEALSAANATPEIQNAIVQALIRLAATHEPFDVQALSQALDKAKGETRASFVHALIDGDNTWAMPILIHLLNDTDAVVRKIAARRLVEINTQDVIEPLRQSLADADAAMRYEAALALADMGSVYAAAPLLQILESRPDYADIDQVFSALVKLGEARTVSLLLRKPHLIAEVRMDLNQALQAAQDTRLLALLRHSDIEGTSFSLYGKANAAQASSLMQRLIRDKDSDSGPAIHLLGEIGDKTAMPLLLQALKNAQTTEIQKEALLALAKLGSEALIAPAQALLQEPKQNAAVKLAAAIALLKFGHEEGLSWLQSQITDPDSYKIGIAATLGELPTPRSVELLKPLLANQNWPVKQAAIQALGQLRAQEAQNELIGLLQSAEDADTRISLIDALGQIGSDAALEALARIIGDKQATMNVRLAALKAAGAVKNAKALEILQQAARQDETSLGLCAYRLLGEQGEKQGAAALPLLWARFKQIEEAYSAWRELRDAEPPATEAEAYKNWLDALKQKEPEAHWVFPLAQAIARTDPYDKGMELLAHGLADARQGAWTGMSQRADGALVQALRQARERSSEPLFRHAAYRALDASLLRLEVTASPNKDLESLQQLYQTAQAVEGVGARLAWTIEQIQKTP